MYIFEFQAKTLKCMAVPTAAFYLKNCCTLNFNANLSVHLAQIHGVFPNPNFVWNKFLNSKAPRPNQKIRNNIEFALLNALV